MGVIVCKYRPIKRKLKRPGAKSGCFHTCLTGTLNPDSVNNEGLGGNVLAYAQTPLALSAFQILLLQCSSAHRFSLLPAHECSRLESRVNSIFLAWAPEFFTHGAFLKVAEHSRSITFHCSMLYALCSLPLISIKAEITSSAQS